MATKNTDKKAVSLKGIDNAAEEKGSLIVTIWQFVKFIVVSLLAMIVQFVLLNTLQLIPAIKELYTQDFSWLFFVYPVAVGGLGYFIVSNVANIVAQIVAFACGKEDENRNKYFAGGRPSSIIVGDQLNPKTLGVLLSHFENKVMFQGFTWNVNSFDQEGVQLGKVLAKKVLAHDTDGALAVYSDLLAI